MIFKEEEEVFWKDEMKIKFKLVYFSGETMAKPSISARFQLHMTTCWAY